MCCCYCISCFHHKNHSVRAWWFGFTGLILAVVFFSLYFAGYYNRIKWSFTAVETECTILGHEVGKNSFKWWYDCECYETCVSTGCETRCNSCEANYRQGIVKVEYLETYTKSVIVFGMDESVDDETYKKDADVLARLATEYPINSTTTCWYQPNNPKDFKLVLDLFIGWQIAAYFILALLILLLLTWIGLTIPWCCKRIKRKCKQDKTRRNDIKQKKKQQEMANKDVEQVKPKEDREEVSKTMESGVSEITVQ